MDFVNETTKKIWIMQAFVEGKKIQFRKKKKKFSGFAPDWYPSSQDETEYDWHDLVLDKPSWNWEEFDYRIKS